MGSEKHRKPKNATTNKDDFLVVGIGASAGGIQALKAFFSNVPKDSGCAYVVILHMSPEHESRLAEILQTSSSLPVTQVSKRTKVQVDNVYVIRPNRNLELTDGYLTLRDMISVHERRSPVDLFFRTLAETNHERGVSVILSGTGTNGSVGLKRIKELGGVVFVQDPAEAEYNDMPRNAIGTGLVDDILPVAQIPQKIYAYNERRGSVHIPATSEIPVTHEQALRDIFTLVRVRTGHDFSNYKRGTVLRRIERRIGITEVDDLQDYARYLRNNRKETEALLKDLLISVTNFFRDPDSIETLAREVLPAIFDNKSEGDQVRAWIAGCATGEEAYTMAMLLTEAAAASPSACSLQIFATDLDAESIRVARDGLYKEADVAEVSPERLRRFFNREAHGYRIRRELREIVLFAAHNLIKDPPFSRLDLISCRNLLIYLNRAAQARVLEVLHFALNPSGYLFLGASESVDGSNELFSVVDKERRLYQSRPIAARPPHIMTQPMIKHLPALEITTPRSPEENRAGERLSYLDLHQRMLEQFAPPSVIINENYEVVHMSDRVGRYMRLTGGEPTTNLLNLVQPELRMELRAALHQAIVNQNRIDVNAIHVQTDEGLRTINLLIRPVFRPGDPRRGFILILFEDAPLIQSPVVQPGDAKTRTLTHELEEALVHSKEQLRATVEQYEIQQEELRASNEELQAINEELRSSTEELETSKEELQSVNEELTTVNQELKVKIEELTQANNDFVNLINSTDIGVIFLDRELRVKLFTPRARDAFNLIQTDIDRPLLDITSNLRYQQLIEDVETVLTTLHKLEREIQSVDGRWFTLRILPYRTTADHIEGVVINFVDITDTLRAKHDLEQAQHDLQFGIEARTYDLKAQAESLRTAIAQKEQSELVRTKVLGQIVRAQEEERRRLARDIHDQLGQQLTALRLRLESLRSQTGNRKKAQADFGELLNITSQLDHDIDFLAWQLRPVVLDDLGLAEALRLHVNRWAEHSNIVSNFHSAGFDQERASPEIENNLYRIAQEALNNVVKHAQATTVDVLLERRGKNAVLIVEDNGVGFAPSERPDEQSFGLTGIRERASLAGGTVEIESRPGNGSTIFVRIPLIQTEGIPDGE